jgi:hypothetical protein
MELSTQRLRCAADRPSSFPHLALRLQYVCLPDCVAPPLIDTSALGLDAIILALCTYRLTSASRRGGISTLLLKEGIVSTLPHLDTPILTPCAQAYFVAAFGANLIETIFAAMNLNPVMNIMCLPFALVASVIAATRAFRHLYTIHDDLRPMQASSDSHGPSSRNGLGGIPCSRARGFAQPGLALNDLRRDGTMPSISVHKVVEVDADPGLGTPVGVSIGLRIGVNLS